MLLLVPIAVGQVPEAEAGAAEGGTAGGGSPEGPAALPEGTVAELLIVDELPPPPPSAAAAPGATFDLVAPGPQAVTTVDAPAGASTEVRFRIAGEGDGPAVDVEGTLSCPSGAVDFGWTFFSDTTYVCTPNGLTLGRGEAAATQVTVHGDHLFYDGLEDPEAEVRGEAFVAADADQDGTLTVDELEIVPVAALGYSVGAQSEVRTLWDFVQAQIPGLGHLDGGGHRDTEG